MRASCIIFLLGTALACGGEPFTTAGNSAIEHTPSNGGNGGREPVPSTTTGATAGGGAAPSEPRAGANSTGPEPVEQTGGTSSDSGGAAAAGEAGAPPMRECPEETLDDSAQGDWELGYFPELRQVTTQESHPFFRVTNRGAPTTLDRIAIRYYFTKESDVAETAACYWVTGDHCPLARLVFGEVPKPTANAERYLEVSFPEASNIMVWAESVEVRVGFKTGSALLLQANDYSFDPNAAAPSATAPFPYKRWLQTTLYVDGALVWGNEPCAERGDVTTF
jgi:hypothetical protein